MRKKDGSEYTARDIFWLSATTLGFVLIPVVIAIAVALLCLIFSR
jgi:hypothetical protein